jgi:hypothetical protein
MPEPSFADERFVHQVPEPIAIVTDPSEHWRESLFFIAHPPDGPGDVVILTLAHFANRGVMDSLQLGRIGDVPTMGHHARPVDGDQDTMTVGPVTIDLAERFQGAHLVVVEDPMAPVALDLTFTARTRPHLLRRGSITYGDETIWDQCHFIQSGTYNGTVTHQALEIRIDDWWGQRDHSWGVRDHARCPLWIWLAIQFPEGMFAVWNWELPDGTRVYTDGCFAPAGDEPTISVTGFTHELHWVDADGTEISYERDGDNVTGVAGSVELTLEDGRIVQIEAEGRWAQRYGPLGGGLNEMVVRTADGWEGTAIYELTGAHHHKYFPVSRTTDDPDGYTIGPASPGG